MESGALVYLTKPLDVADLLAAIDGRSLTTEKGSHHDRAVGGRRPDLHRDDQAPNVRLPEQVLRRAGFANTRSFADGRSMFDLGAACDLPIRE
jgi:DNA-binding response OmpR family regulator